MHTPRTTRLDLIQELLELRVAQDAEWPAGLVARHAPLEWANQAVQAMLKAGAAGEDSAAFRRRLLRAASYLLVACESFDTRSSAQLRLIATLTGEELGNAS